MGFGEAIRTVLTKKYATFSGRASRSEYWWFQLFFHSLLACYFLVSTVMAATTWNTSIGLGILVIAFFLPQIALAVRRLHDRNLSGWWYLGFIIAWFVPYLNLLAIITLIVLFAFPGTKGLNRFGPDPLNPQSSAEVFA
ncbi:hypothetical protein ASD74_13545 [Rhizobium sp. Root564]|nr:hypothetical protein ASD74_13545 [Rhizobium sp. Root564]